MALWMESNKVTALPEAAALVNDGDKVGVGGALSLREPIGMIRELIRQGKKDLHIIGNAHGFDVDLMCGGGLVGIAQVTHVSFELDFGLPPHYKRMCESGEVKVKEDC